MPYRRDVKVNTNIGFDQQACKAAAAEVGIKAQHDTGRHSNNTSGRSSDGARWPDDMPAYRRHHLRSTHDETKQKRTCTIAPSRAADQVMNNARNADPAGFSKRECSQKVKRAQIVIALSVSHPESKQPGTSAVGKRSLPIDALIMCKGHSARCFGRPSASMSAAGRHKSSSPRPFRGTRQPSVPVH